MTDIHNELVKVKAGSHIYGPLMRYNAEELVINLALQKGIVATIDENI